MVTLTPVAVSRHSLPLTPATAAVAGMTDHEVRVAAKAFAAEVGVRMFDVTGTWGIVAFTKGQATEEAPGISEEVIWG